MSYTAGSSVAAAAAIANAVKAMGAIVKVEEEAFQKILSLSEQPLVLVAPPAGLFQKYHRYATSYKGFIFYMDSREPVMFGRTPEMVSVPSIGVPTM